ncbi:MAG: aminoglycoside 6'-N-acetyltransferase [Candidatus Binatia bacterium]
MGTGVVVRYVKQEDWSEWLRMRRALWPRCSRERHESEMSAMLQDQAPTAVFVSRRGESALCGFIELAIRPFAEGCQTGPVGYIEGWYVDPDFRWRGIGRSLVAAAEQWARSKGCKEMASDTEVSNLDSEEAHRRLGYTECSRLVHFKKDL